MWFVKAQEQIFGPFADERLPLFVAERRLSERTLISRSIRGPFGPAGLEPQLRYLFEPAEEEETADVEGGEAGGPSSLPAHPGPLPIGVAARANMAPEGAERSLSSAEHAQAQLLIVAELSAVSPMDFRTRLEGFGPVDMVAGGAFLVSAQLSSADLRNSLSRGLGPEDRLLVVELSRMHAAWFNLPAEVERRLFKL